MIQRQTIADEAALPPAGAPPERIFHRLWRQGLRCAKHRAASTFLLTLFSQGAALLTSVILARVMPLAAYGEYLYALSWTMLIAQLGILGFDRLVIREVAARIARQDLGTLHGFIRFVFRWEMTFIVTASLSAYGIAWALEHSSGVAAPKFFGWAMLIVPVLVLLNLQMSVVRGTNRVVESQIPEKLIRPLAVLALVGVLFWQFGSMNGPMVLAAYLVSALAASLWAWRDMKRFVPPLPEAATPLRRSKEWLTASLHLSTVVFMFAINARADSLLLGALDGAAALAIYMVALRISQSTSLAVGIFNVLLGPNISSRHALGDHAGLQGIATRYAWPILGVNLLTLVPVVLLCQPLVGIFGPAFAPAVVPLLILCGGQFATSLAGSAGNILINCGEEAASARVFTLTCLTNIGLNLLLIPRHGAIGAAIAASISLALKSVLLVWLCLRKLRINPTLFPFKFIPAA